MIPGQSLNKLVETRKIPLGCNVLFTEVVKKNELQGEL